MPLEIDSKPLLSVILPAYNVEKYIEQCINSILNQTYSNFELLIADDGSQDNTKEIIDLFDDPRIRLFHNDANYGKTYTVNKLFLHGKGKYITVHDSDDWSLASRFEKQLEWLQQDNSHLMCGTGFNSYDLKENIIERFIPLTEFKDIAYAIKTSGQFHGPTMMFRKDAIDEELIYRPYFKDNYEDTDLAYRLFQKGICTNIVEPLYCYRILESSLCRREYTVRNTNLYKVVVYLAKQREEMGIDDLKMKQFKNVDMFFQEQTKQYNKDKSLIYREGAAYYMYWKYYKKAIKYAISGIWMAPLKFENWRTFLYCVRKAVFQ